MIYRHSEPQKLHPQICKKLHHEDCLEYEPESSNDTTCRYVCACTIDSEVVLLCPLNKVNEGEIMEKVKEDSDNVNHPPHYNKGNIECIDAIIAALGDEGFENYIVGNVIKYLWRYKHRNGIEDLKKAQWYLNRLIDCMEEYV